MSGSNSFDAPVTTPESGRDHPLGLTVYDLPEPGQVLAEDERRTRAGRWKMLLLLLISSAPVALSYFTYYVIRPQARHNYGELIEPQRPLPDVRGIDLQGQPHPLPELKGQWLLVSVGSGHCEDACQKQLYFQRQLRESLGKDKDRLDRVWLVNDEAPVAPALLAAVRDATVLRVPASDVAAWLQPADGHTLEDHLYLVDPLGHWMMRFPAHMDIAAAAKAKHDLERLMRASNSWDLPGREMP